MKLKIAVVIDVYSKDGGASKAAYFYSQKVRENGHLSYFACTNTLPGEDYPDDVTEIRSEKACEDFIRNKGIDVIHYFKAAKSIKYGPVFKKFITARKNIGREDIKVITTVCQQPSYPNTILTPFEIYYSDYLIFIDKTAYNDPLYSFIPKEKKTWMYLSATRDSLKNSVVDQYVKQSYELKNNTIVFGRGSTLNKCPKDTLDVYDQIKTKTGKKFVIIGVPETKNWLTKKINKREEKDIETYPLLPITEYAKMVSTFDVMLYYIPDKIYSSIDGSLRTAMRMGVPVVVCGAPAPKETVVHGENGYIANNAKELVEYAEKLANDVSLREKMGKAARRLFFENAPEEYWPITHIKIVEDIVSKEKQEPIKTPVLKWVKIYVELFLSRINESLLKIVKRALL